MQSFFNELRFQIFRDFARLIGDVDNNDFLGSITLLRSQSDPVALGFEGNSFIMYDDRPVRRQRLTTQSRQQLTYRLLYRYPVRHRQNLCPNGWVAQFRSKRSRDLVIRVNDHFLSQRGIVDHWVGALVETDGTVFYDDDFFTALLHLTAHRFHNHSEQRHVIFRRRPKSLTPFLWPRAAFGAALAVASGVGLGSAPARGAGAGLVSTAGGAALAVISWPRPTVGNRRISPSKRVSQFLRSGLRSFTRA